MDEQADVMITDQTYLFQLISVLKLMDLVVSVDGSLAEKIADSKGLSINHGNLVEGTDAGVGWHGLTYGDQLRAQLGTKEDQTKITNIKRYK